jgi:hypothetical protein
VHRIVMMLGVAMFMLVVAAGVAVAVEKTCENVPCVGTENDDELHERDGSVKDRLLGKGGKDRIEAVSYTNDRDVLKGQDQGDRLVTVDGDRRDAARGGSGRDTCFIDQGDARRSCERVDIATTSAEVEAAQETYGP